MELNAEQYFQAGLERMRQARLLYQAADCFALCMYTAGLAVECVLRAFRWRKDPSFSGRHDLMELFAASGILPTYETHMRARGADPGEIDQEALELHAAMQVMAVRWANSFRFASEARLRARYCSDDRVVIERLVADELVLGHRNSLWPPRRRC